MIQRIMDPAIEIETLDPSDLNTTSLFILILQLL